jgi:hypothetical protein
MDLLWSLLIAIGTSLIWGVSFLHIIMIVMACIAGLVWILYHFTMRHED